jgi:hypothetical protein
MRYSDSRRFFYGCFVIMMAVIQTGVFIRYMVLKFVKEHDDEIICYPR